MSPKKPGLTYDEHEKLSLELHTMKNRLNQIRNQLNQAYRLKISEKTSEKIANAQMWIYDLCSELDHLVCKENQSKDKASKLYCWANRPDTPPQDTPQN